MELIIRMLLEEQSDQGLHCMPFHSHLLDNVPYSFVSLFEFQVDYCNVFLCPKILELYDNLLCFTDLTSPVKRGKEFKWLSHLANTPIYSSPAS